jgi:hypothetical protein
LTSAINNGGHPTLPSSDPRDYDHYVHEDMLDAIASILVRHEEVVAVAVSGRNVVAMQEQNVAVNTDEPDAVHAEEADYVADGDIDFEGPHYAGPLTLLPSSDPQQNYTLPVPMQAQETEVTADEEVTTGELDAAEAEGSDHPADDQINFAAIVKRPEYKKLGFQFSQIMLIKGGKSHLPKIPLSPDGLCKHLLKKIK